MIPKPLVGFLDQLFDATDEGKIEWAEGAGDNSYYCARNNFNIHISYWYDTDNEMGYYNMSITGGRKPANFAVTSHEHNDYIFMTNLHTSIQLNAAKIGDISDRFFE